MRWNFGEKFLLSANSFSGPKIFWDFRETGLWFKKIPLVTHAFQYPATKTTREAEWYFYFCMLTGSLSNLRNINSNYKHHFLELFRTGNLISKKRFFLSLFGLLHFVPFPGNFNQVYKISWFDFLQRTSLSKGHHLYKILKIQITNTCVSFSWIWPEVHDLRI